MLPSDRPFYCPLAPWEVEMCVTIGKARSAANDGYADGRIDQRRTDEEIDVDGTFGEYAYCKVFGYRWTCAVWTREQWRQRRREPDIEGVQIKTRHEEWHGLMVREACAGLDPPGTPYVLACTAALPMVTLVGWEVAERVFLPHHLNEALPKRAYLIEKRCLQPMRTFRNYFFDWRRRAA